MQLLYHLVPAHAPASKPQGVKAYPMSRSRSRSRSFVDNDPHFIVSISGLAEGVCFDIDNEPGTVYQLLHDPSTGESRRSSFKFRYEKNPCVLFPSCGGPALFSSEPLRTTGYHFYCL